MRGGPQKRSRKAVLRGCSERSRDEVLEDFLSGKKLSKGGLEQALKNRARSSQRRAQEQVVREYLEPRSGKKLR